MSAPFPILSEQKQPSAWTITPNAHALKSLAEGIWACAKQTQQRPLVVLSTAGPIIGLRAALEEARPKDLSNQIAYLPQVISFADWLETAPNAWKFPKKQSDVERWISVYVNLRKHPKLKSWFKAESDAGAWGLAQAVIDACDALTAVVAPQLQGEMNQLLKTHSFDLETWFKKVELVLDQAIAKFGQGSAEANALEAFINGDIPVEVIKGNMNPTAFRDYFAEVLQPIALVMGKKVKGNAAEAASIFFGPGSDYSDCRFDDY